MQDSESRKMLSQRRILYLLSIMSADVVAGWRAEDLAKRTKTSPATLYRDLALLQEVGWASSSEDGRWRVTTTFCAIANAARQQYQAAADKYQNSIQSMDAKAHSHRI